MLGDWLPGADQKPGETGRHALMLEAPVPLPKKPALHARGHAEPRGQ